MIKTFILSVVRHVCDSGTGQVQAGVTCVKSQPVPQETLSQKRGVRELDAAQMESWLACVTSWVPAHQKDNNQNSSPQKLPGNLSKSLKGKQTETADKCTHFKISLCGKKSARSGCQSCLVLVRKGSKAPLLIHPALLKQGAN